MPDQDRIAEILTGHRKWWSVQSAVATCTAPGCGWSNFGTAKRTDDAHAQHQAELIDAALQPRIETVEELDALPLDTVVVDAAGIPRTKRIGDSHMPSGWTHGGRIPLKPGDLADGRPMRVVYAPEADR